METLVEKIARKIETMEIRGAHRLARAAADALVGWCRTAPDETFFQDLERVVQRLEETRPTAVSLRNALAITLSGIDRKEGASSAKEKIRKQSDEFLQYSERALDRLATIGAKRVDGDATIMTICNSTAAVGVMKKAHEEKGVKMVYALETRPRRQGLITARELAEFGVPVTLVVDNAMGFFLDRVDVVLTGADSILPDGTYANKIGTSTMAFQATERGVPVYSCAETYKFHPGPLVGEKLEIEERSEDEVWEGRNIPGVKVRNPAFDLTPPGHYKGVICEKAIMTPVQIKKETEAILRRDTYGIFGNR